MAKIRYLVEKHIVKNRSIKCLTNDTAYVSITIVVFVRRHVEVFSERGWSGKAKTNAGTSKSFISNTRPDFVSKTFSAKSRLVPTCPRARSMTLCYYH